MYDTRLRLSNQVVEEVKIHFQQLVFDTLFIEIQDLEKPLAMEKL